ncbi:hypothetical protein PFISCL1PPCAC_15365, partial [Pristionchus fissidentatus]
NTHSRLSHDESPIFSYPMQMQPSHIHPQQSHQPDFIPHNQMISSSQLLPQSSFLPQIKYNQPIHTSDHHQMWYPPSSIPPPHIPSLPPSHPSSLPPSLPPSYPLNPQHLVYFTPYTNPPAAFLPSKNDSFSDEDYDSFPSDCYSLFCEGICQTLCLVFLLIITIVLGAFLLGLFSL